MKAIYNQGRVHLFQLTFNNEWSKLFDGQQKGTFGRPQTNGFFKRLTLEGDGN